MSISGKGRTLIAVIGLCIGMVLGYLIKPYVSPAVLSDKQANSQDSGEKKPLYWVAPMDKNYRRDGPGKSPMGMDLVPVYEEASSDGSSVKISPVVENNLGVKTAEAVEAQLEIPITTIGSVGYDESRVQHIHSRVEGWIETLGVSAKGDPVRKGQTLFELYSPELVNAQQEFVTSLRVGNESLTKASRLRLMALGLKPAQVDQLAKTRKVQQAISVYASQDGYVLELNVRKGMFIRPADEVMMLGNLDTVWVQAEIFERQASLIESGQTVVASLNGAPDKQWQGTIDYIYPELDAVTRTLQARVRISNKDQALKPNMLVNLNVMAQAGNQSLTIPRSALIKTANHTRVVKALGDGRYQSVIIKSGHEGMVDKVSSVQVLDGLNAGDVVVTSAQFLIDSESNVDAELARMEQGESSGKDTSSPSKVMVTGTVNGIVEEMGMVSITHAPIPEWEWPTMKMDFAISDSIGLEDFKPGETIRFELEKTGDWDYLITAVEGKATENPGNEMPSEISGSDTEKVVKTSGEISMLMLDMDMLEVVHEPIPEWGWPVMKMMFVVAENETLPSLATGDKVNFTLKERNDGQYEMSNVNKK